MGFCIAVAGNDPRSLAERAPELAEYRIPCLEITWHGFRHWDLEACRRDREGLAREGLRMYSVHAPFGPELNIVDRDPGARLHAIEAHLTVLRGSAELGAGVLVMHPGRELVTDRSLREIMDLCVQAAVRVTEAAAELGMVVSLENCLPAHAVHSNGVLRDIVDAVGSPALGICFDIGHAHIESSVKEGLRIFGRRINHLHLHDNDGSTDAHLCPSLGTIDWPAFLRHLRELGTEAPLTLECRPPDGVPPDGILDFARRGMGLDRQAQT